MISSTFFSGLETGISVKSFEVNLGMGNGAVTSYLNVRIELIDNGSMMKLNLVFQFL